MQTDVHYAAGMFRNPAAEVLTFLRSQHAENFRVYNLCAEHVYDSARLGGQVVELPCEDHQVLCLTRVFAHICSPEDVPAGKHECKARAVLVTGTASGASAQLLH